MSVFDYLARRWSLVLELLVQHLLLVAGAILLATIIGVSLGVLVYRSRTLSSLLMTSTNTLYTVPSLSAIAIATAVLGFGTAPAVVATTAYALLPIVRNTLTGLGEVDPAVTKSAAAMGMSQAQQLRRVELPLAWPVILTGVRIATVLTAGIATIAAYTNGPGLGILLFQGLKAIGSAFALPQTVIAVMGIVLVALSLDTFVARVVAPATTPRGAR